MKANADLTLEEVLSLRVGSIVLGEEYIYDEDSEEEIYRYHPCRILGIDETHCIYINGDECIYNIEWLDDYDGEHCSALRPMPLTKDILNANSIKWSDRYEVFTDAHHFSFAKDLRFGRVYNMDDDKHREIILPFEYIHEVQDALVLCGLYGLAYNFKIK